MRHPPTAMNSLRNLALMLTDTTKPTRSPPNLGFNAMMKNGTDTTNLADGAPTNDS